MKRKWSDPEGAVALVPMCVVCGQTSGLERAHVVGRARDRKLGSVRAVDPHEVVWLCVSDHVAYDAHRLDLYPFLTDVQRAGAIRAAGSSGQALRRLSPQLWKSPTTEQVRVLDERLAHLLSLEGVPDGSYDRPPVRQRGA